MSLHRYRSAATAIAVGATFLAGAAGVAGASTHQSRHHATHHAKSTPRKLAFRANGTPILTGLTIKVANSAGSAHIADSHIYAMTQFLKNWGANVTMTNASSNISELGVASGSQDLCTSPVGPALDAGLTAFGPNQTVVADALLVPKSITKLSQLKGKSYADDYLSGDVDYPLWAAVAKKGHFPLSSMHLITTGAETNSFNQVVAGKASAAWVDPSTVASAGPNFHALVMSQKVDPTYADSMMFARQAWLKANPALAEAVDLAWIAAAWQFVHNEPAWAQQAYKYTAGTNSLSVLKTDWAQLHAIGGFPISKSAFSPAAVRVNYAIAKNLAQITANGNRPFNQLGYYTAWDNAWSQYSAHTSAYHKS